MSIAIIHVSDLHFAGEFFSQSNRGRAAIQTTGRPSFPVRGLASHDYGACEDLGNAVHRAVLRLNRQPTPPSLVLLAATGDLTVSGDDSEFVLALTYLRGTIGDGWASSIGLGKLAFDDVVAVPGNHDHWGGSVVSALGRLGPVAGVHGKYFPTPSRGQAWWFRDYAPSSGPVLQLMGLDSCSGPGWRPFAQGRLASGDVMHLGRAIQVSNERHTNRRIVRFILIHHGLKVPAGFNGWAHALDPSSELLLRSFVRDNEIHRVLTGHMHQPWVNPVGSSVGEELRCGTTLQASSAEGQTFLLHIIEGDDCTGYIETTTYQRTRAGGFHAGANRARVQLYSQRSLQEN